MIDVNQVKSEAEKELREEKLKEAKENIKSLLRKKHQAQQVVSNIEREIADAYATIGENAI